MGGTNKYPNQYLCAFEKVTKRELFYCALTYFRMLDDRDLTDKELIAKIKEEANLYE